MEMQVLAIFPARARALVYVRNTGLNSPAAVSFPDIPFEVFRVNQKAMADREGFEPSVRVPIPGDESFFGKIYICEME